MGQQQSSSQSGSILYFLRGLLVVAMIIRNSVYFLCDQPQGFQNHTLLSTQHVSYFLIVSLDIERCDSQNRTRDSGGGERVNLFPQSLYRLIQVMGLSQYKIALSVESDIPDDGCLFCSLPYAILYAFDSGFIDD